MLKNIKAGDTTCLKTFTRASIDIQGMYNYSFIQVGLLFVAMVVIIQYSVVQPHMWGPESPRFWRSAVYHAPVESHI